MRARAMPTTTGSTVSRWEGLAARLITISLPAAGHELARLAQVVLDVAGALHGVGGDVVLELPEQLPVGLADDVDQHVQPAAVGHAEHRRVEGRVGGVGQEGVEERDRRLGALDAEALLGDVAGGEELLERLGRVEAVEDVQLLVPVDGVVGALDLGLDPVLLVGLLDVHVLDADRAAVGVAQDAEDVAERGPLAAGQAAGEVLPVEVPDRQPVAGGVELLVHAGRLHAQRVEVGDEVPSHPVHVDQRVDLGLLLDQRFELVGGVVVHAPLHGHIGHVERREHVLVEAVAADQQLVHLLEEHAGLGALDDAVVVGGGDRHGLGDPDPGQRLGVRALERGGVVDAADADDQALALHQPGDGLDGAQRAGVGQRDRGAGEVVRGQLLVADLADQVLVGAPELPEGERVGVADDRHDQGAGAIRVLDVDGEADVHGSVVDDLRRRPVLGLDEAWSS